MRKIDVGIHLISYLEKYKIWSKKKFLEHGRVLAEDNFINESLLEPISRQFLDNFQITF